MPRGDPKQKRGLPDDAAPKKNSSRAGISSSRPDDKRSNKTTTGSKSRGSSQDLATGSHDVLPRRDYSVTTRKIITDSANKSPGALSFYTLFSGYADEAPREPDGGLYLWRRDFDFFEDAASLSRPENTRRQGGGTSALMSRVAEYLQLGRGKQLVTESAEATLRAERQNQHFCRVPTPGKVLSVSYDQIPTGLQDCPKGPPRFDGDHKANFLHPIRSLYEKPEDAPISTSTLAQKFVDHPSARWFKDRQPRLRLDVPVPRKMLLWARMMLLNDPDIDILKRTGIYRGVLASLFRFHADPALVAAFLTFWNVDGHTLITSHGEMGYPLHTIPDAMGIPISGRLYEEFIPFPSDVDDHLETLYTIC